MTTMKTKTRAVEHKNPNEREIGAWHKAAVHQTNSNNQISYEIKLKRKKFCIDKFSI